MAGLKPTIITVEVGVRELKQVPIYPLSMADQLALPDKLVEAVGKMANIDYKNLAQSTLKSVSKKAVTPVDAPQNKDMELVKLILGLIQENVEYILEKSTDGVTLSDLTNNQFVDIVDIIFTINYEQSVGKVADLVQRAKKTFRKIVPGPMPQESTEQSL